MPCRWWRDSCKPAMPSRTPTRRLSGHRSKTGTSRTRWKPAWRCENVPDARQSIQEPRYQEAAEFLGTVFGYLDLAQPLAIKAQRRMDCKNQILTSIGKSYEPAFDRARAEVAATISMFKSERQAVQDGLAAKAQRRVEDTKSTLTEDRSIVSKSGTDAQSSAERLQEAQREFAQIEREYNVLIKDRSLVAMQVSMVQAQVAILDQNYLIDNRQNMPGGVLAVNTRSTATPQTIAQLRALTIQLAGLNKQAFDMDRKLLSYRAKAAELAAMGVQEAQKIADRQAVAEDAESRAQQLEHRLKRQEEKANSAASAALTGRMKLWTTYAPFPYAQEKQRVLRWFDE